MDQPPILKEMKLSYLILIKYIIYIFRRFVEIVLNKFINIKNSSIKEKLLNVMFKLDTKNIII